jgi:hypothetical protein
MQAGRSGRRLDDFADGGPSGRASTIADVDDHRSALEEEGYATGQRRASNREEAFLNCGAAFKECALDAVVDKLKPEATEGFGEIGANRFAPDQVFVRGKRLDDVSLMVGHHSVDVSASKCRPNRLSSFAHRLLIALRSGEAISAEASGGDRCDGDRHDEQGTDAEESHQLSIRARRDGLCSGTT